MTEQPPKESLTGRLVAELGQCRRRGLDDLDVQMHTQPPVPAPELERLAREYSEAKGLPAYGRAAQIRALLQDGVAVYEKRSNVADSRFIARLFFEPSASTPPKRPGSVLAEVRAASGLDERRFDDYRRSVFARFADFLITFVAEAAGEAAGQEMAADATDGVATPKSKRSLVLGVGAGIVGLVVIGGIVAAVLVANSHHTATSPPSPINTSTITSTPSPTYVPGKTYTEETGEFGSPTFTDPHNPSVTGIRVKPYEKVKISCKVLAPTIPSVSPDGYWYRIASSPWNNKYYSAANTYLNGDKIGAPALHNTDFKVPDCPG